MKNDDLILKGNQLVSAAKDGKIGLVADEIVTMQKSYIAYSRLTPVRKTLMTAGGGLSILGCLAMLFGAVFGGGDFILIICSLIGGIGGWFSLMTPFMLGRRANEYKNLIEREYPKIVSHTAA